MLPINLPQPSHAAQQHSERLVSLLQQKIQQQGPITFAEFMQTALYAPGLGYYSAGSRKFGREGDFVTAPEISSLFSQCVAKQCQQALQEIEGGSIVELGAGSGAMAADILTALAEQNHLPKNYYILEISADLRERQQQLLQTRLPEYVERVVWLDHLPAAFAGIILANEVMDAMPVHRFQGQQELYVDWQNEQFCWRRNQPSSKQLARTLKTLDLPEDYTAEINLQLAGWLAALSACLQQGVLLAFDYGFPRHEYYHPDRSMGTLMCHYRHHSHDDPLILLGLQDITAHVDFTAVLEGAAQAEFALAGYTSQAQFLLNCGIAELAGAAMQDVHSHLDISQQLKHLTLPSEMGELVKAIALSKNIKSGLLGFRQGNRHL